MKVSCKLERVPEGYVGSEVYIYSSEEGYGEYAELELVDCEGGKHTAIVSGEELMAAIENACNDARPIRRTAYYPRRSV